MSPDTRTHPAEYSEAEIARQRDEVVKRMLATPPQPKKAKKTSA